jgi:hypothetical protein
MKTSGSDETRYLSENEKQKSPATRYFGLSQKFYTHLSQKSTLTPKALAIAPSVTLQEHTRQSENFYKCVRHAIPLVCLQKLCVCKNSKLSDNVSDMRCEKAIESQSRVKLHCKKTRT